MRPQQIGSVPGPIAAWLQLVRELLGGARTQPGAPLRPLNDAANSVLAQALEVGAFGFAHETCRLPCLPPQD